MKSVCAVINSVYVFNSLNLFNVHEICLNSFFLIKYAIKKKYIYIKGERGEGMEI